MLPGMRPRLGITFFLVIFALTVAPLNARVVRVEIASRNDVLNGKTFRDAGACERIIGRVYFSLPVSDPHNHRIVDLSNAVNLKNGEVEFSSDFVAVCPKDARKGNDSMLLKQWRMLEECALYSVRQFPEQPPRRCWASKPHGSGHGHTSGADQHPK